MRHDPAGAAIVVMLRGLKMFGMAQAAGGQAKQGRRNPVAQKDRRSLNRFSLCFGC